ncbi:MAG: hypothetical protein RI936_1535 [Pseudomonadota bacterium]
MSAASSRFARWRALLGPQVSPAARELRDTVWLLAAVALVVAPQLPHVPAWVAFAVLGLIGTRLALALARRPLPGRWLMLALLVAVVAGLLAQYRTVLGREAGVSFLLLLLGLKLLELRARRDIYVVITLSFFLLLTQFLRGQGLGVALLVTAAVGALFFVLVSVSHGPDDAPAAEKARLVGGLMLKALPLTLVLFVLFPRVQGPLWRLPGGAEAAGITGLSNSMSPGSISRLIESDEIALRASFQGPVPPPEALYWRGPVFDHYDGRTWRASQSGERVVPATRPRIDADPASRIDYTVTLEPHRRDWLLALDLPLALPAAPGLRARLTPELELVSAAPVDARLRYDASSALRYSAGADTSALELRNWVELPPGLNPRTQTLAAQLRAQQPPGADVALVQAVLQRFRREDYRYTLEPPPLGEHAVDDFLFETRAGYCEHYASATAVLLRALDIPARVVTGYQGGELNPADGQFTVRQSDAHAWVEAWLQGRGWVRLDPTAAVAPSRVERGATRAAREAGLLPGAGLVVGADWVRQLRFGAEALQNTWNQWVLSYSPERQRNLVRRLGLDPDWHGLAIAFAVAIAALSLGAAGLALWRTRRARDPLALAWDGLRERLAAAGVDAPPWIGPRELARRARRGLVEADARAAQALSTELEALRYAPSPPDAAARVRALRRAVHRFRPRPQS